MKRIKEYVDRINDELCDAQHYAEEYVWHRANGETQLAARRKEAATDEIKHAMWIHDVAVAEVEKLKQVYQPPVEMLEKWDEAHKHYVEKAAWIKTMLAM